MRQLLMILLAAFCLSGCASSVAQGKIDFQHQQYPQAFNELLPLAKQGNADAQYAVGYMYYYGQGVIENREQAQYWINKAAQQNQPLAVRALEIQAAQTIAKNTQLFNNSIKD